MHLDITSYGGEMKLLKLQDRSSWRPLDPMGNALYQTITEMSLDMLNT